MGVVNIKKDSIENNLKKTNRMSNLAICISILTMILNIIANLDL